MQAKNTSASPVPSKIVLVQLLAHPGFRIHVANTVFAGSGVLAKPRPQHFLSSVKRPSAA